MPNYTLELLDIAKSSNDRLNLFKRGVYLQGRLNRTIDELRIVACISRWALAKRFLQYARAAHQSHPAQCRLVIGRSYYCMYHAARAVVYLQTGGDDHEEHSVLPQHLPGDFPNLQTWKNKLRSARLERNRADYDPFPKTERAFANEAQTVFQDAVAFINESRTYLVGKNVPI